MGCFGALSLVVGAIQFRIPGVTGGISDLRDGAGTRFDPHIVEVFLDRVAGGDGVAPS